MTTTLADMLADIRRSLGVSGREAPRLAAVEDRLDRAPKGLVPARGQVTGTARIDLFKVMAEGVQASVDLVAAARDVPAAIAAYLRAHNLPAELRLGGDARLAAMPWSETPLSLKSGPASGEDLCSVSHAMLGIAETGTLVLHSGPDNPTTLNFLPDNHIVVVEAADIAGDLEEAMRQLRNRFGKGTMARTVNFITGPSRSGDIEQTIFLGAHGPRRLHVVVVGAAA
jgi:L-lactate dehydrogenase complex protein LldG